MKKGVGTVGRTPNTAAVEEFVESFASEVAGARLDAGSSLVRQGVSSIALIRLVARVEEEFSVEVDLGEVLKAPTLIDITAAVMTRLDKELAE